MSVNFVLDNVYYVSSEDSTVNPIAIRPKIRMNGTSASIEWNDTARGVFLKIATSDIPLTQETLSKATKIDLVTDKHRHIHLQVLTKNLYVKEVQKSVSGGVDTSSDETIRKHYLEKNFGKLQ
jgi:hypothetical protein